MKKFAFLLVLLFAAGQFVRLSGQSPSDGIGKIQVKGVYHDGKTWLRWVPLDYKSWQQGNQYGYQVIRQTVAVGGVLLSDSARVNSAQTQTGFLPLPEAGWEPFLTDDMAGVAAGAIYADDFDAFPAGADELYIASLTNEKSENRFGFGLFAADQSFSVALKMGLALTDSVPSGNVYNYRIIMQLPDSLGAKPSGLGEVETVVYTPPVLPGVVASVTAQRVLLSLPRGDLDASYSSYNMERSTDSTTWIQRNDKPLLFMSTDEDSHSMKFTDSLETVGTTYFYRLRGKTPFDIVGPASNVVSAAAKLKPLGIYPVIERVREEVNSKLNVEWTFPAASENAIQLFQIFRSKEAETAFVKIGEKPKTDREFLDPTPDPLVNYYKIVALDNGDNPNESLATLGQLNDTIAPSAPSGLQATVDKNGLVKLQWNSNPEDDVKGYRVFFSNYATGDFAQITTTVLENTLMTHQLELKVLSKNVFYRLLATDFRENNSPLSAVVQVSRPDILPPTKALLTKVEAMSKGVHLEWIGSQSEDVVLHKLQRKRLTDFTWEDLGSWPVGSPDTVFWDSTTMGIQPFSYRMLAVDDGGLTSSSTVYDVKPVRTTLDTIARFRVTSSVDGALKQAKLSWEYPKENPITEFQVYRGGSGAVPHIYATMKVVADELDVDPVTNRAVFIWRDQQIEVGSEYSYQVLAKYSDGNSSPLSGKVMFQY